MKTAPPDLSRRRFLRATGGVAALRAGVGAPLAPVPAQRLSASSSADLKKLSENLYCLEDTCNVYLVRNGSRAVLIDFGAGKILDHLAQLGVTRVDWILHTHHHRD